MRECTGWCLIMLPAHSNQQTVCLCGAHMCKGCMADTVTAAEPLFSPSTLHLYTQSEVISFLPQLQRQLYIRVDNSTGYAMERVVGELSQEF